jgi:hypothetical protein
MKIGDTAIYVSFDLNHFKPKYERVIARAVNTPVREYIEISFLCICIEVIRELR